LARHANTYSHLPWRAAKLSWHLPGRAADLGSQRCGVNLVGIASVFALVELAVAVGAVRDRDSCDDSTTGVQTRCLVAITFLARTRATERHTKRKR